MHAHTVSLLSDHVLLCHVFNVYGSDNNVRRFRHKPLNSWTAPSKKCIFFPFQVVWHDGVRELPNSWQWLVEHDNGTGSNQKEINVELSRINLGLPLICKVNSSALDAPISKKIHGL